MNERTNERRVLCAGPGTSQDGAPVGRWTRRVSWQRRPRS